MPLDLTDKSTLVQVMAWCRQATSHCLSQCWPRSICLQMASLGLNELKSAIMAGDAQWVQVTAWHLFGAKPLTKPMLTYCLAFVPSHVRYFVLTQSFCLRDDVFKIIWFICFACFIPKRTDIHIFTKFHSNSLIILLLMRGKTWFVKNGALEMDQILQL